MSGRKRGAQARRGGAGARSGARTRGARTRAGRARPTTIDEYLATLSRAQRAALEKLRRAIKSVAPGAEECVSYGIPAFRFEGRMLVGFGARAGHGSFYPWSGTTVKAHRKELEGYETTPGAIHFRTDDPLPTALVRKLVRARIAGNRAKRERITARRVR